MSAVLPPQLTKEQIAASLAAGLLPLLGPYGMLAADLVPGVQAFADMLSSHPGNYTMADAIVTVQQGNVDLAKLQSDAAKAP